jgi:hypothetical protein
VVIGHIFGIPVEENLPSLVPVGAAGATIAVMTARSGARRARLIAARLRARVRRSDH